MHQKQKRETKAFLCTEKSSVCVQNGYEVKDQLKRMGFKFDWDRKIWMYRYGDRREAFKTLGRLKELGVPVSGYYDKQDLLGMVYDIMDDLENVRKEWVNMRDAVKRLLSRYAETRGEEFKEEFTVLFEKTGVRLPKDVSLLGYGNDIFSFTSFILQKVADALEKAMKQAPPVSMEKNANNTAGVKSKSGEPDETHGVRKEGGSSRSSRGYKAYRRPKVRYGSKVKNGKDNIHA